MNHKVILSNNDLVDWLIELNSDTPRGMEEIEYPAVFPHEIIKEGDQLKNVVYPPSPLYAFDLEDATNEMIKMDAWYADFSERGMPADEVNLLLQCRNRMSRGLKPFGVQVARLQREADRARHQRDLKLSRLKGIYRNQGDNVETAKFKAMSDAEKEINYLKDMEESVLIAKSALRSFEQTLNAMSGVRDTLKRESYAPQQK